MERRNTEKEPYTENQAIQEIIKNRPISNVTISLEISVMTLLTSVRIKLKPARTRLLRTAGIS